MYYKVTAGSKRPIGPTDRDLSRVRMPKESYGQCKYDECSIVSHLANGLCQKHWDSTLDKFDRVVKNVR